MGEILSLLLTHPGVGEHMHTGVGNGQLQCSFRRLARGNLICGRGLMRVLHNYSAIHIFCVPDEI
jgi:hypothetical protein